MSNFTETSDADLAARLIAFYLPQFHPTPENDAWWGKGFTEWTNVARARSWYRGHYQPHVPSDLGFYDLRLPEAREAQAAMAREYGVEAFCYYHYWFGGRRILERPFNEVLASGEPDFPFCLCWANHSWTGIWEGCPGRTLIEQVYPGLDDHRAHFETLLKAFSDPRYVTVDGKPLFLIYQPARIPEVERLTDLWRELALKAGLTGLYLVGMAWEPDWDPKAAGFDASTPKDRLPRLTEFTTPSHTINQFCKRLLQIFKSPTVFYYEKVMEDWARADLAATHDFPCVIPNWDNTPRSGANGLVLHGSTPELFRQVLRRGLEYVRQKPAQQRIVFIKSWNEWAEGNYLEPDLKFGRAYLDVVRQEVSVKHSLSLVHEPLVGQVQPALRVDENKLQPTMQADAHPEPSACALVSSQDALNRDAVHQGRG